MLILVVALERRLSTSQSEDNLTADAHESGSAEDSPVRENAIASFNCMFLELTSFYVVDSSHWTCFESDISETSSAAIPRS